MTITKTISRIITKITLNLASVLRNIKLGKIFKLGGGGQYGKRGKHLLLLNFLSLLRLLGC
ncbi:MAG: hypothetical protein LBC20_11880 [Planctomycetaceae bacterium]|jgi:hypothetical protein|nr:hypothetical protein [Planctomycetaceae bacterium]